MTGTPQPQPTLCVHCRHPTVDTDIGLTHLDSRGHLAGWLCPPPQMTLATWPARQSDPVPPAPEPRPPRDVTPVPPIPRRRHIPEPPPQLPY
ncbi:MAG TPA: hypothetical protein VFZ32_16145 [Micromonosporaceae bacterium]